MKRNTLRMNAVLGSFFAALVILSPALAQEHTNVPAQQPRRPEPPKVTRKANNELQASAINRFEAVYPPAALAARVFGTVLVEVSIDESGSVTSARAISGHPLLRDAAADAARGWTFKPTLVQGKPIKVVGTMTFAFKLPDYVLRDRVIEQLKQRIAKDPQNSTLHYRLGQAYEENEQLVDALKAYEGAVGLKRDYADAHAALGTLNMKMNQYEAALRAYNQAVVLDLRPEIKAAAYRSMALIYFRRAQFREAIEPFKQAIALAPQAPMYLNLGLTYLKLGDRTSAMEQYRLLKERNSILAAQLLREINASQ